MCTQTEPRNINELLQLDTYQEMTDEEIETIIEYRANQKFHSMENTFAHALIIERANIEAARNEQLVRDSRDMLQSMKEGLRDLTPIREIEIPERLSTEVNNG